MGTDGWTDRRTVMMKLIVAFRNFTNGSSSRKRDVSVAPGHRVNRDRRFETAWWSCLQRLESQWRIRLSERSKWDHHAISEHRSPVPQWHGTIAPKNRELTQLHCCESSKHKWDSILFEFFYHLNFNIVCIASVCLHFARLCFHMSLDI